MVLESCRGRVGSASWQLAVKCPLQLFQVDVDDDLLGILHLPSALTATRQRHVLQVLHHALSQPSAQQQKAEEECCIDDCA